MMSEEEGTSDGFLSARMSTCKQVFVVVGVISCTSDDKGTYARPLLMFIANDAVVAGDLGRAYAEGVVRRLALSVVEKEQAACAHPPSTGRVFAFSLGRLRDRRSISEPPADGRRSGGADLSGRDAWRRVAH